MRLKNLFLPLALFWASFGIADSIKCFTCRSDVESNCGDPFYNVSVDMPSCGLETGQGVCTKTRTSEGVVIRGCGLKTFCQDPGEDGCEQTSEGTRCCCPGDGCNSAPTRLANFLVLTAVTLLAVVKNAKQP